MLRIEHTWKTKAQAAFKWPNFQKAIIITSATPNGSDAIKKGGPSRDIPPLAATTLGVLKNSSGFYTNWKRS